MGRDRGRRLKLPAVVQKYRDAGRTEGVAAQNRVDPGFPRASPDHREHVLPTHPAIGELPRTSTRRAEQGSASVVSDRCREQVTVHPFFGQMMAGDFMVFPAFLVEAKPVTLALRKVIFHLHSHQDMDATLDDRRRVMVQITHKGIDLVERVREIAADVTSIGSEKEDV